MEALLGALILFGPAALGYLLGVVRTKRKFARQAAASKPQRAICESCDDAFGHHDPHTGHCHAVNLRPVIQHGPAVTHQAVQVRCTCRRYVGPIPLDVIGLLGSATTLPVSTPTKEEPQ